MPEASDKVAARAAKFETHVEYVFRILAGVALITSLAEVGNHADELCVASKGAAAIAIFESTGNFPDWTPPEYNPIDITSGPDAMNAMLNGAPIAGATTQPSTCF